MKKRFGLLFVLVGLVCCSSDGENGPDGSQVDGPGLQDGDCRFDYSIKFSSEGAVLQFASADKKSCVYIKRRDDSQQGEIYKAIPYTLLEMRIGHDGQVEAINDAGKLSWTSTHHNWNDQAKALGAADYALVYRYEPTGVGIVYEVSARTPGTGALIWGPHVVLPVN